MSTYSVLLRQPCYTPRNTAEAVRAALGYGCSQTAAELLSALKAGPKTPGSLRGFMPYDNRPNRSLHESYPVEYNFPYHLILGGNQNVVPLRSAEVQVSLKDLCDQPVPVYSDTFDLGPDVLQTQSVDVATTGEGTFDSYPWITIPQYNGTPAQGQIAWQRVVPLLGVLYRISWSEGDDNLSLQIGRSFLNVPNSFTAISRVTHQDDHCRQVNVFVFFTNHRYEAYHDATVALRYNTSDYSQFFNAGDDFQQPGDALLQTHFRVLSGTTLETGSGYQIEAIPVPLTLSFVNSFWPAMDGRSGLFMK